MDLEERTVETLPERCQNCGAELTEAEQATALEEGSDPVLCTTCAAEAAPVDGAPEEAEGL